MKVYNVIYKDAYEKKTMIIAAESRDAAISIARFENRFRGINDTEWSFLNIENFVAREVDGVYAKKEGLKMSYYG